MARDSNGPPVVYFEPGVSQTIFVDGLAFIEDRGSIVRLVWWEEHTSYDTGEGRSERQIAHRLIMTQEAFRAMLATLGLRPYWLETH